MRFGGLIGLTWQDVDFENEQIRTYRSLNTLTHKFTPPKHKTSNCKLLHIDWQQLPRPIKTFWKYLFYHHLPLLFFLIIILKRPVTDIDSPNTGTIHDMNFLLKRSFH
ncbi:hypothetical protein BTH44_05160 [Streptococcus agalactiae]|nr:hypothetical protein BTH44_05160 [Streptococcus agalactiae]OZV90187.1 hypothetical protein CFK61_05005 [Streptococcus agalactiae]PWS57660.1 hypothetical protein CUZ51_04870 [Streptococcus agalactiae]PWS59378.1 hypothetical protein CUZ50_04865 [Streptococcus agalactiae]PWS60913.1 hypothetical protein CUZ52_04865 [Streptococcus agalactiae]